MPTETPKVPSHHARHRHAEQHSEKAEEGAAKPTDKNHKKISEKAEGVAKPTEKEHHKEFPAKAEEGVPKPMEEKHYKELPAKAEEGVAKPTDESHHKHRVERQSKNEDEVTGPTDLDEPHRQHHADRAGKYRAPSEKEEENPVIAEPKSQNPTGHKHKKTPDQAADNKQKQTHKNKTDDQHEQHKGAVEKQTDRTAPRGEEKEKAHIHEGGHSEHGKEYHSLQTWQWFYFVVFLPIAVAAVALGLVVFVSPD